MLSDKPVYMRLMPDERRTLEELSVSQNRSTSSVARLIYLIVIDKIDTLVAAVGFVLVTRKYLDAVATLGEVGVHCECARRGYGECRQGGSPCES
ncbi:hypothetical protein E2R23_16755 [Burkholderia pseudomallei]|nr:hypothetical protein E2R23_16755 [Burkholderia pseudomallei]